MSESFDSLNDRDVDKLEQTPKQDTTAREEEAQAQRDEASRAKSRRNK